MSKKPSTGNAFDWRGRPSIFSKGQQISERQVMSNALRVNREATSCSFVPPERAQKIRLAKI